MTEAQLHKSVTDWLNLALVEPCWFTTFPAGGGGRIRGANLKGMGLKPGVPDILVLCPRKAPIWIELKTAKGKVSKVQKECHQDLKAAGSVVAVCRTIGEVAEVLRGWQVPLRAAA